MLCAISGEAPQQPVASIKSGNVFEKRLIEAYIAENHKDPVNGEDLETTDLVDLKSARIVTPRPPTLTSIPSLLAAFQTEWDALALETFTVRQQLHQTRQELATALYQHDAAVRVVARLTKERDEARDALSKVSIAGGGAASNGADAMQVDSQGLPADLVAVVEETQERLSKSRRKRPVPDDWIDAQAIASFVLASASKSVLPDCQAAAVREDGDVALIGAKKGVADLYSISKKKVQQTIKVGEGVTAVAWCAEEPIIATVSGTVRFGEGNEHTVTAHEGPVAALAVHPSSRIVASVGVDKSLVFYDTAKKTKVAQVYTDSELTTAHFHPDGHLFAAGGQDGQIKLYHVKNAEHAGVNFQLDGPVQDLSFSENGILFAGVAKGSSKVVIFDIRKEGKAAEAHVLEIGGQVDCITWDYSSQFLAAAGPGGLTISQYAKASKSWSDVISLNVPAVAVAWGFNARTLITINDKAVVNVLGSS